MGEGEGEELLSVLVLLSAATITGSEGVTTQAVWVGLRGSAVKMMSLGTTPLPAIVSAGQNAQLARVHTEQRGEPLMLAVTDQDLICMRFSASLQACWQCICVATEQFVSTSASAAVAPVEVLIDQALQSLPLTAGAPASPARDVTYFDQCVERFSFMTSGSEVLALLNLLLDIPQPPAGYLQKYLHHAEVSTVVKLNVSIT